MIVLGVDIGGTKTVFQIVEVSGEGSRIVGDARYASKDFPQFPQMVAHFFNQMVNHTVIETACFAVAGPIDGSVAKVTNLPWVVDAVSLKSTFPINQVVLANDFEAIGHGLGSLDDSEFLVVQEGIQKRHKPSALIGAGTGLGQALIIPVGGAVQVVATEGGHVDFAPTDEQQVELMRFLKKKSGFASYDQLLSGPGLENIYRFLLESHQCENSDRAFPANNESDLPAAINHWAEQGTDPLAEEALNIFMNIYGAQAGNLALTCLAEGGVYISGGIAAKISDRFLTGTFLQAFKKKSKMQHIMEKLPVKVVLNQDVGLIGAVKLARQANR